MTRALSNDLRERAVEAVRDGETCRAVASRLGVAGCSVVKWSKRYRATGSVAPGKMGGHRKRVPVRRLLASFGWDEIGAVEDFIDLRRTRWNMESCEREGRRGSRHRCCLRTSKVSKLPAIC